MSVETLIAYRWLWPILAACCIGYGVTYIRSARREAARNALQRGMNIQQAQDHLDATADERAKSWSCRIAGVLAGIFTGFFVASFLLA